MSKILEHLKRIKLHRLGHWSVASVRNGNDTQTNKLLRQLSKAEKKQYRLWCDKAFWMQHAAVQECGSFPFDKTFTWIVRPMLISGPGASHSNTKGGTRM
jgi:hypothetical protein